MIIIIIIIFFFIIIIIIFFFFFFSVRIPGTITALKGPSFKGGPSANRKN